MYLAWKFLVVLRKKINDVMERREKFKKGGFECAVKSLEIPSCCKVRKLGPG